LVFRLGGLTSGARFRGSLFAEADEEGIEGKLGPVTVRFVSRVAKRRNKLAVARPKDLLEAELLEDPDE